MIEDNCGGSRFYIVILLNFDLPTLTHFICGLFDAELPSLNHDVLQKILTMYFMIMSIFVYALPQCIMKETPDRLAISLYCPGFLLFFFRTFFYWNWVMNNCSVKSYLEGSEIIQWPTGENIRKCFSSLANCHQGCKLTSTSSSNGLLGCQDLWWQGSTL